MANCNAQDKIDDMQEELIDRFGKLPPQAQSLIETHRLRIAAVPLGIRKIDKGAEAVTLHFIPNPPVDAIKIIDLVQKNRQIKLAGQDRLRIENIPAETAALAQTIRHAMRQLS